VVGQGECIATKVPTPTKAQRPKIFPTAISGDRRMLSPADALDNEDLIALIKYPKTVPYIYKNAVGAMGVSHSGEERNDHEGLSESNFAPASDQPATTNSSR